MLKQEVEEIIACLPAERTIFHYYRDRYAFALLARACARYPSVRALRASPFRALLEKPIVRAHLATTGAASPFDFGVDSYWPSDGHENYTLTLSGWGSNHQWRDNQTSRRGYNLVLQLNLDTGAFARFARLQRHRPPDLRSRRQRAPGDARLGAARRQLRHR
ncbi:MAG: hypothetical protein AAF515_20510 [Pseudomonadota bacterium]